MPRTRLLLASQSPRRRELLTLLAIPFDSASPNVAEDFRMGETPAALVARLSQAKSRAVAPPSNGIVIACDTVVSLKGELLGKPNDATEATAMLRRLRECPHTVHSSVTLWEPAADRVLTEVIETQVVMRPYTAAEVSAYVASGDPLDKAGAYAIQHPEFNPVAEIKGCYTNVMGLPLCHLARSLHAWKVVLSYEAIPAACQSHTGYHCTAYADILASPV